LADAAARSAGPALSIPTGAESVRGIFLICIAYLVVTGADVAVKWALPEVGVSLAMLVRGVVGTAAVAIIVRGRGLLPKNKHLLALRSLLHCCVSATWYWAWQRAVPLADSYAIACAAPLLMTLLAIPMLAEKVGWRRWTSTMLGFAGVLFMLQPSGDLWRLETPFLLAATVVMAVTRIWTRVLSATDGPAAVAFWLLAAHIPMGLIFAATLFPFPDHVPGTSVMVALLIFGVANAIAHLLFSRAFALAPVSALAPFEYTPLIWGTVLGFMIWAEVPAWTTLGGAAIVIAAGLYNLHRERVRRAMERRQALG